MILSYFLRGLYCLLEEVFSSNKALWFSPDGTKLAFGRFDDTAAPLMVVPIYGQPGSLIFQYPRANIVKYPKVINCKHVK